MPSLTIAVIGGGAAGFFGAITAAETFPDATVTIYEKSRTVLNKVRISGGGRCNVTHACFDNRQLVKHYPRGERWLRPLLTQFDASATVQWFEGKGVRLKTEPDGRMFPVTNSSETIIDCLRQTADRLGIRICTSVGIATLTRREPVVGMPHHRVSDHRVSDHRVSDHRVSDHRVSDHRVSDHRVSDHRVSDHRVSDHRVSDHRVSDHRVSDHRVSDHRVSDHRVSDHRVSDHRVSDHRVSDHSESGGWQLQPIDGDSFVADRVLIATGGYPQLPSYGWLPEQTEPTIAPVPSLFTFNVPDSPLLPLAGVSVADAKVQVMGTKLEQRGPLLLTHWGFSGPAVLKLSAWAARELASVSYRFTLRIHWIPDLTDTQLRDEMNRLRQQHPKKQVVNQPLFGLPARLWRALTEEAGIAETQRWADLPAKNQNRLAEKLTNSQFQVSGKSTFKDEFVTCGGIALGNLDPQTLESRAQPGLFFAGEVLDVDGVTGGFNFQNAWTTGYLAGKHIGL